MASLPVVGVTACRREIAPHSYHVVQHKYVAAVRDAAGALPFVIPSEGHDTRAESIVAALGGLVLTRSYSNVAPQRYGEPERIEGALRDRDETTARLIRVAVREGCPILGISRGLQELNVAFGGTLHQALHDRETGLDHREQGPTLSRPPRRGDPSGGCQRLHPRGAVAIPNGARPRHPHRRPSLQPSARHAPSGLARADVDGEATPKAEVA